MLPRCPDFFDAERLSDQGETCRGNLPLEEFTRLAGFLLDREGQVEFELNFTRDEDRRALINGHVHCRLQLECQRCLQVCECPVDAHLELVCIRGLEEARHLPADREPWMIGKDGRVSLRELLEEELLLALPGVARHDNCEQPGQLKEERDSTEAMNPFSVLAALKHKDD